MYQPQHEAVLELMAGAYDLHTHTAPDTLPRIVNDFELTAMANDYGMAGVMLKNHSGSTAARAALVNSCGKFNTKAYGSIVLNSSVGGLNPQAVETSLRLGAKMVWMPTIQAHNHIEYVAAVGGKQAASGIRVLNEDGTLKPEVYEILELIKQYGAVVATGHISLGESAAVIYAACDMGVKCVLTHPDWNCTSLPIEVQKAFVKKGAMVEKLWLDIGHNLVSTDYMALTIRELGAENVFLSTDRGQIRAEYPVEGLMMFMDAMLDRGFNHRQVYIMTHDNPACLIG